MTRSRYVKIAVVALLIAVFVMLRVWKMGETCLWFDEIFSVHAASQPWNSLLAFVALDLIHPPLFYLILKAWIAIGGDSTMWLRMLPLACSVLAILPLFLLLDELKQSFNVKALTLCILIVSGSILKYSLEVRMYSLMLCLSLFSIWLFVRSVERRAGILPLIAVNILLIYTHYFGWFVVASEGAAALLFYRGSWKKIFAMAAVSIMAFTPWIAAIYDASGAGAGSGLAQNIGWMSRPGVREITVFAFNVVEPFYCQLGSSEPISNFLVTLPVLVLLTIIASFAAINWREFDGQTRKALLTFATFVAVPLALAFSISWLSPYSIWGTRHLIVVFVPFYLLIAIAGSNLKGRTLRFGLLGCALLACLVGGAMNASREPQRFGWCEAGPITSGIAAEVPIYAVEDLIAYHLWFDHRKDEPKRRIVKLDNTPGLGEDTAYFLPRGFSDVTRTDVETVAEPKLWLVQRGKQVKETEPPLRNFLLKGYKITDRKTVGVTGEEVEAFLLEK
ncbi:MAG: glycosyltransferase family 39 protein [Pyrinomonadaceae bacterium]